MSYIGANSQGIIGVANTDIIDGSTISNATITDSVIVPTSPFSFRNRIISGDMRIDQRNAGSTVTPTDGSYFLDRYLSRVSQTGKLTTELSSDAPVGFDKSLLITSTSAYSVLATDFFAIEHRIEGNNVYDLIGGANAKTITVSFYVKSSLTGTFGGALANGLFNRCYPFSYSITSANIWERKSITLTLDTTGTWATDNGIGLRLNLGFGVGTNYSASSGSWQTTTVWSSTGATSLVGTSGATFYITGVQLEEGTVATPFEHRPIGVELGLCQRYYQKSYNIETAAGTATSTGTEWLTLPSSGRIATTTHYQTEMRDNATVKVYDWAGTIDRVRIGSGNGHSTFNIYQFAKKFVVDVTTSTNTTELLFQWTANAEL